MEGFVTLQRTAIFLLVCEFLMAGAGKPAFAKGKHAGGKDSATVGVSGVPTQGGDTPGQANAAWEAKDWESAAKLYEELSKQKDAPPRVWLRLGGSLRALGKYEQALAAFQKATESGAGPFAEYGKAATYVGMKNTEEAFTSLDAALQQ